LDLVIIRSCNLVGGRQRARKLIPTAVQHLANGEPVPVFGSGIHRREYLAVEDLCDALLLAIDRVLPTGVYHCTSGIGLRVADVISVVADALDVAPKMFEAPDRLVHDLSYAMDSSLLRSHGWREQICPVEAIASASRVLERALLAGEDLTRRRWTPDEDRPRAELDVGQRP
jgi:dTDP-glucose 4,6-dehydratase